MAEKKSGGAVKETAAKKAPAAKKESRIGKEYECEVCGLAVTVDEDCGCAECEILCCEEPMKQRSKSAKSKAGSKAKAA